MELRGPGGPSLGDPLEASREEGEPPGSLVVGTDA